MPLAIAVVVAYYSRNLALNQEVMSLMLDDNTRTSGALAVPGWIIPAFEDSFIRITISEPVVALGIGPVRVYAAELAFTEN